MGLVNNTNSTIAEFLQVIHKVCLLYPTPKIAMLIDVTACFFTVYELAELSFIAAWLAPGRDCWWIAVAKTGKPFGCLKQLVASLPNMYGNMCSRGTI